MKAILLLVAAGMFVVPAVAAADWVAPFHVGNADVDKNWQPIPLSANQMLGIDLFWHSKVQHNHWQEE